MDDLRRAETTIVCTSNQPPAELKGLIPRLANRFRGGLCVAVRIPGPASRTKLLSHFCSHLQLAIPQPVIRLFANIMAGHIGMLVFFSLIFIFGKAGESMIGGYGAAVPSIAFTIFLFFLELLVAAIQAYVFTLLSAIYFGMAVHEDHH